MNLLKKTGMATAEFWDFTTTNDPINGRVDTYYKAGNIKLTIMNLQEGSLQVFSETPLRFNAQLRNLRDYKGNLIFEIYNQPDIVAYIGAGEPVIDVWGKRRGFRYAIAPGPMG